MPQTEAPTPSALWAHDPARESALLAWIDSLRPAMGLDASTLELASADASARRYLRVQAAAPAPGAASFIIMDCPPQSLSVQPFVDVAQQLQAAQIHAPRVLAQHPEQGFLLLSDLGSTPALQVLQAAAKAQDRNAIHTLLRQAIELLVSWQCRMPADTLAPYDDAWLQRELDLFPQWCVEREFGQHLSPEQQTRWATVCELLKRSALAQPTVAAHRDFMARNFMVTPEGLALLDFQDAARGPISYDIASLIRDAFFSLEEEEEIDIAVRYWQAARKAELPVPDDFGDFWRQIEWMGLQRHLKVLGIFCRLKHRDGKAHYAQDLPRFFHYAHKVATRYHGLGALAHLLEPLMGTQRVDAFY
jgi:aminoglycoside/choline kinase family phosphotransferase